MCIARDRYLPSDHNPPKIGNPIASSIWWCKDCGKICAQAEIIGDNVKTIDPIWMATEYEIKISRIEQELKDVKDNYKTENNDHDDYWRGIRIGLETCLNILKDL